MQEAKRERSVELLQEQARLRKPAPPFAECLRTDSVALIAEIKHMSPSAGVIRDPFDPVHIAEAYEAAGVQAVSVLMDRKYFDGSEKDFRLVRSSIQCPMLYKEFVIDPWQIWHAASLGASAILLIAAALDPNVLASFLDVCHDAGIEPLLEVHDQNEMAMARDIAVECIGINNRNLKTFEVSLETTFRLKKGALENHLIISESGISDPKDVEQLKEAGIDAILVGEHLLKHEDLSQAISALMENV